MEERGRTRFSTVFLHLQSHWTTADLTSWPHGQLVLTAYQATATTTPLFQESQRHYGEAASNGQRRE
jgi:hypothetical protein